MMMDISIIIPVYNEQQNLRMLHKNIHRVLDPLKDEWEIVYVNDGSTDNSLSVLSALAKEDKLHVEVVELRRNFGQTAALAAGIDYSQGGIIILMDADMQNDPADIPKMLKKLNEGYDVVSGWRKDRKDRFINRTLPSKIANGLISWVTGVKLHDYGCTLKAYRREVLTGFRLYGEMHRFIPVYAHRVGAKIFEMPVRHHPRKYGKTKYGLERTVKVILDLFTVKYLLSYANKPIYLFGGYGLLFILISGIALLYLFFRKVFFQVSVTQSPLFILSVMVGMIGVQSILLGLIAELQVRTYHESQGKPIYVVRQVINGDIHKGDRKKAP
jgi:glycosyltransferase involved in cell wall biosynthesis